MEQEKKKKKVNRLKDMIVSDVDLVDRAANARQFLLFKREGTTMPKSKTDTNSDSVVVEPIVDKDVESQTETETEIEIEKSTTVTETGEQIKKSEAESDTKETTDTVVTDETQVVDDAAKVTPEVEKQDKIPKAVKETVVQAMSSVSEKLMDLVASIRAMTPKDGPDALPNELAAEIKNISAALGSITEKYPSPTSKADSLHGGLLAEKIAAMSAICANLPSMTGDGFDKQLHALNELGWSIREMARVVSAVEAVTKSDTGIDTEQSFLKQASTISISKSAREKVMQIVRSALERLLSIIREVREMEETEEDVSEPLPKKVVDAINMIANDLKQIMQSYPSPSMKSDDIKARLTAHFDGIKNIIGDVMNSGIELDKACATNDKTKEDEKIKKAENVCPSCGYVGEEEVCPKCNAKMEMKKEEVVEEKDEVTKNFDGRFATMEKKFDEIKSLIESTKTVEPIKKTVPGSNAGDTDTATQLTKKDNDFKWPSDIAAEVTKKTK